MSKLKRPAYIRGVALTPFGRLPGRSALSWQAHASLEAIRDASIDLNEVDAVLCGYATTLGHLMPANLLSEALGIKPTIAFGMSVGGATGLSMLAQATALIESGRAQNVLVAAGENRASGLSRDDAIAAIAQVGQRDYEVPLGANVPAYYALLASYYLHRHDKSATEALSPLAVLMRTHALAHPGAQFHDPITTKDVSESRPIAEPLRLLDCCPISDGGAAFVVSAEPGSRSIPVLGVGQSHRHQHVSMADFEDFGARQSAQSAFQDAGVKIDSVDIAGIYDSFTITLAILLEEIGFAPPGHSGECARAGTFSRSGRLPLNTHGGLLSYGHCGVGGGMAHVAEVVSQLRGEAGTRQIPKVLQIGFVHADGGVLSAHVSVVLGSAGERL